ncbi:MAG: c-type cytochrome [Mangrovicoccus sp.]
MTRISLALSLALSLAAGSAMAEDLTETELFQKVKITAGQTLFEAECRRCHATDPVDVSYGPPLEGVVGRVAGSYPDYEYSEALQGSGIVWTKAALRAWLEDNDGFMPGTRMRHVGIEDPVVQDFILAYLETLAAE